MNASSHEIESRLKLVRGRIRNAQRCRASWVITTVALGGLLLIMAADWFFAPLPVAVRWILSAVWLVGIGFVAKTVLAPLFKTISLVQIARWIELRHPEMEERLSTVLELSINDSGVSPELLEALAKAAGEDVTKVDPRGEIRAAQTKMRWGKPALGLAAVLLITLAVFPQEASRLLVRAVAPFSDVGNAGAVKFKIEPGHLEVMEGDRLEIKIRHDGGAKQIDFLIRMDGQNEISQPLVREGKEFRYLLDPARKSFKYRVQSGRAQSDIHTATVWPLPVIIEPRVTLDFQSYTGLLKREEPLGEGVEAVEGTSIGLHGKLNTPVEQGWLEIDGRRVAEAKIEMSAGGGRVDISWKPAVGSSGEAVVKFKHRLGREIEALRFPVKVVPDQIPQVVLVSPSQKELKVRPDEVLDLRYEVTEDFSLAATAVEVKADGDRLAMFDQNLPLAINGTRPPRFEGSATITVGQLRTRFPGATEMRLRVRAEDGRPANLGGPGVGNSEWLLIRIDQNAESLARQELRAEHDEARETIEKAIQQAREAKDQMDGLREQVKKEALEDNAVKSLDQATEKLARAEESIAELAKEMEQSIHAAKADEVQQAAAKIAESREDLENAPLQDKQESREAKITEAKENAEQAIKQLEQVRDGMDRDREKIQDLARMLELARQQQEIARQAQQNLETPQQSPQATQDWKNLQKQMEEALRQALSERPEAKAEALLAQAEAAKEMAREAREVAEAQKNLQEQAKQSAEAAPATAQADPAAAKPDPAAMKEHLQEALAKEQAGIAAAVKQELAQAQQDRTAAADLLPEANTAADAALDQIQTGETQAAADSAQAAAAAMKEASAFGTPTSPEASQPDPATAPETPTAAAKAAEAAQAETLAELAERQEQVAGAMEALAKGNLAEALQGLQEAQAAAAAELASEIKSTPLAEGSGNMSEAGNKAQQGSEQAKAAEAKGETGQQQQAASQHEQAAQNFQKSAEALDRAATEFSQAAAAAAAQQANPNKAPLSAGELAEAFQQAAQAAASEGADAAQKAAASAAALAQASQAARSQMQGLPAGSKPAAPAGPPGMASPPGTPGVLGELEGLQQRAADPGVPPELAKLGITASDWEKIQANLASDIGSGGPDAIPKEYRSLVKGYFESMSKKKD